MKKVAITGSTGMLGVALINECVKNGIEVYAIIRPGSKRINMLPKMEKVHVIECDMREYAKLPQMINDQLDVFYHFAWGHTGARKNADMKYQIENINSTIDALRAAQKMGCHLFVGSGSQAEYGIQNVTKIGPECQTNPVIPYGVCKLAAGKLAEIEGKKIGINVVWVRVFSVYGINDKPETLVSSLIRKMKNQESISMTQGIQIWDYLFSEDAGKAFYLIGKKCIESKLYCLGSGIARPLKDYVGCIANILNYEHKIGYGNIPYAQDSVMNLCADISLLSKDVNWNPSVSFQDGINKILNYSNISTQ